MLSVQGAQVQALVREVLCAAWHSKKKKKDYRRKNKFDEQKEDEDNEFHLE